MNERILRAVRDSTAIQYQRGNLTRFMRGYTQGQLDMLAVYADVPRWILQGIENEIMFICQRANEAGQ
jgi:hypothetical protein